MTPGTPIPGKKTGLPPGTLIYIGKKATSPISISVIQYKEDECFEYKIQQIDELKNINHSETYITWININGIYDIGLIQEIGILFQLDPLTLEDIVNTQTRPKLDEYENYIFCVIKDLYIENEQLEKEQLSFVLKERLLITFQEEAGDVFENVRNRIRTASTKIRTRGADYLMYALIDAIVDNYFVITDWFDKELDQLEEKLYQSTEKSLLSEIQQSHATFNVMKRVVVPAREVIFAFYKSENNLIKKKTHLFIRDLMDHIVHISESLDQARDKTNGLMSIYISGTNQAMNNIMKTLTIISTVFMALSLIAGIYGMNFNHMPELEWEYGYYATLGLMVLISVGLLIFFRKKKWL